MHQLDLPKFYSTMLRTSFLIVSIFLGIKLQAQELLKVRLYSNQEVKRALVTTDSVDFVLLALNKDQEVLDTIHDAYADDPARSFIISRKGSGLQLKKGDEDLGVYQALSFHGLDTLQRFRILANRKERAYYGDLIFKPENKGIYAINQVDLELYVAGVVESEAGHVPELEFFKAQAVLARTFAIRNINKHAKEGYNLKDDVSSQVYHSMAHYTHKDLIERAVAETRDSIVIRHDCRPILGVFHANSGGETVNSEDVWFQSIDQLRSIPDSFSVGVGSYNWEKKIKAEKFYSYFARMFGIKNDLELQKALLNLNREGREAYFKYKGKSLKLTKVRSDFRLRSTYFKVEPEGEEIVLKGFGFGHGVGMAQDGAIAMSGKGYSYKSILKHYYQDIEFDSLSGSRESLDFKD